MNDHDFILITRSCHSMAEAAAKIGLHFSTFKKKAVRLNCYVTNQGGRGHIKSNNRKIPLSEILNGLHPQYSTFKLKLRLFSEGVKENKCEECGCSEWNGKQLNCELDHINGNSSDHRLKNLRIICPNCHSQTETYRFKRGKQK